MGEKETDNFKLELPLDASGIEGFEPESKVRVAVQGSDGSINEKVVRLDAKGKGTATLTFSENPGALQVAIGPETASAEELFGMQTIRFNLQSRLWKESKELKHPPIRISAYYWHWWLIWCRTFTIRGIVVCPNGSPVPGAKVCAYDVDMWWWWCSKQQVGCATTDANGAFEIKFRWCCGWLPWWWWAHRVWHLEPSLVDRILPVLQRDTRIHRIPAVAPTPDLSIFEGLLSNNRTMPQTQAARMPVNAIQKTVPGIDLTTLDNLRIRLKERLPAIPDLEKLRIWPWWPWHPWWDCTPDIIFHVTQNCKDRETVIVEESCWDTRWNIPTTLNVTLVANKEACCIPPHHNCLEGDCVVITQACSDLVNAIGGNIGAPATPVGYENPGSVSIYGDRPYADAVTIYGTAECMTGVDYYEFEWSDDNGANWHDMPVSADGSFTRTYLDLGPFTFTSVVFSTSSIDGRNVYETLEHYEASNPPANWGITRLWVYNRDLLINWLTKNNFADKTYHLRVKGWNFVGGHLVNPRVLQNCGDHGENDIVLTIDNRFENNISPDPHGHVCGTGTVHTCTTEPDTAFLAVKIIHKDGTETGIGACSNVAINDTDMLQIDFVAHDPDGHLAYYTLDATYDVNLDIDLLAIIGGVLSSSPVFVPWAPAAAQVGPNYGDPSPLKSALNQGAVAPHWNGGAIRLLVKAKSVFPKTCCYQLVLRAHKRTIVGCDYSLWGHTNTSEYSFTVVV